MDKFIIENDYFFSMANQSSIPNEYILDLVKEALNDVESANASLSSIIRKCIRICKLRNDYINLCWLNWEMTNINKKSFNKIIQEILPHFSKDDFELIKKEFALAWIQERKMVAVGPDLEIQNDQICSLSVGEIELGIESNRRTAEESFPPKGLHPLDLYFEEESKGKTRFISNTLADGGEKILERIRQRVHGFLSETERQILFGQVNADIFDENRQFVDLRLGKLCPDAISQFASVYKRMQDKDPESYAQAATSCRRIIKSLADALYPPLNKSIRCADNKDRTLSDDKYISRLHQYIHEQTIHSSSSALLLADVDLICNKIEQLYRLTCKGAHSKISEFEIKQIVIQTYLMAGDILRISENQSAINIEEFKAEIAANDATQLKL